MTVSPLNIFLVDEDPVFRLGLKIWLDQRSEFRVIGEAATAAATLQQLSDLQAIALTTLTDAGEPTPAPSVDVVILDLGLGQGAPEDLPGLQLCGEIKRQFPQIAVLLLSPQGEPVLRAAAKHMGADGFGPRGMPVRELARLIQQVTTPKGGLTSGVSDVALPTKPEGIVAYLHKSSIRQIDAAMAEIEQAAMERLPYWYRLVLAGKYRELRAARHLIRRILPLPENAPDQLASDQFPPLHATSQVAAERTTESRVAAGNAIAKTTSPLPVIVGDVQTRVCEAVFRKLQFPLENCSEIPLEIDILRPDKARELLYTTLRVFESLLDDLRQAQLPAGQVMDDSQTQGFLHDLWQAVTVDFFGRYYTPPINGLEQPMVGILQQDAAIVQTAILDRIPETPALLAHLLFQAPLEINGASYIATTPESLRRSQFLLENLLINVACAVMQPVLNRFANVESLKRSLYQRRILSTRDITRFRNDLSWRYRWDALVNEPKAIFESQYRLLALTPQGIQVHRIYAPRQEELAALSGAQYVTTLALEARDAIAPRLRTALSLVGSGVVFVLTELIGRGIGLVGRGIAKGIGNAWQESRLRQRQRDEI